MNRVPIGTFHPVEGSVSPDMSADTPKVPLALYAAPLRERARRVLNFPHSENRLTLILSIMAVIGLAMAVPALLDCLLLVIELLPYLSDGAAVPWLTALYALLWIAATVCLTVPLITSVYRIAVLMTVAHGQAEKGETVEKIGISECLYPFTSAKAYGRSLFVGLRGLGSFLLTLLPSGIVIAAASWWVPLVSQAAPPIVYILLWIANITVACFALVGMSLLTVKGTGFGYFVFAEPDTPLSVLRDRFRSCRRSAQLPLWLMLGFAGWILVSLMAVFVPLLLHTFPHMLLSWASYGRFLTEACTVAQPEAVDTDVCDKDHDEITPVEKIITEAE